MQLPSLYQSSEKMRSPPHNTFCRLCTDKEPRQQLRSHTRWGRHSFPQIQTTPSSAPRHYEKCGCCTVVNVAPPNLSVPVAATKFRMSWCFSKIINIWSIFYDVWMLLQQRSFDPVFDELMSFTDPSGLIYISHCWAVEHTASCSVPNLPAPATAGATVTQWK